MGRRVSIAPPELTKVSTKTKRKNNSIIENVMENKEKKEESKAGAFLALVSLGVGIWIIYLIITEVLL